jgi:hypothetical protein
VVNDDESPAAHGRPHTPLVLEGMRVGLIRATAANGLQFNIRNPSQEQWDALMILGFEVTKGVQPMTDGV